METEQDKYSYAWSDEDVVIHFERAARDEPSLVDAILHIDLQTFSEATFSWHSASAMVHYGDVFVLRAEGEIIGSCVLMRQWDAPGEALLVSMGILPGWRGRGLGQFFVGCTLRRLASEGLEAVTLHVGAHNRRAVRLYREVGFVDVGELQAPGSAPDRSSREKRRILVMRVALAQAAIA